MIPIPQNLYEQYLTDWLYEKKFQEDTFKSGQSEIELLYRLSKAQMLERDRGEEFIAPKALSRPKGKSPRWQVMFKFIVKQN